MNTNSYYTIGHGHKTCQDYASHGETENFVYAIIADGCSDAPDSDVGARLITRAFINGLERHLKANNIVSGGQFDAFDVDFGRMMQMQVLYSLQPLQQHTGLPDKAFNTTLVALVYCKMNNKLYNFIWGDGFVFARYKDKDTIEEIKYPTNAPYYFSYKACNSEESYKKQFGDNHSDVSFTAITRTDGIVTPTVALKYPPYYFSDEVVTDNLEFIGISSDGLGTFSHENGNVIPSLDIVKLVMDYKSLTGDFVERRMNKIAKDNKKTNIQHYDDISVAVINFT